MAEQSRFTQLLVQKGLIKDFHDPENVLLTLFVLQEKKKGESLFKSFINSLCFEKNEVPLYYDEELIQKHKESYFCK